MKIRGIAARFAPAQTIRQAAGAATVPADSVQKLRPPMEQLWKYIGSGAARAGGMPHRTAGSFDGAEMEMVQLQSYMAQRQRAIHLATRLVETTTSSTTTIAGNIGK